MSSRPEEQDRIVSASWWRWDFQATSAVVASGERLELRSIVAIIEPAPSRSSSGVQLTVGPAFPGGDNRHWPAGSAEALRGQPLANRARIAEAAGDDRLTGDGSGYGRAVRRRQHQTLDEGSHEQVGR